MRITSKALGELQQQIAQAEIHAVGGQYYLVRLWLDGDWLILSQEDGQTRLFTSTTAVRRALESVAVKQFILCHESPYDEMIGLGPAGGGMRLPLSGSEG